MKNKEALLGVISAFIRSQNYESKRDFLKDYDGLGFMSKAIRDADTQSVRLLKKAVFLLYDLVINDDVIFKDNP